MEITKNSVVYIHYTLKNEAGTTLDSSREREPLAYIQGIGNLIKGLETRVEGRKAGDKMNMVIPPEEGYGDRKDNLIQVVPKSGFQSDNGEQLTEGMQVQVNTGENTLIAYVTKVEGEDVTLDMNHPLAGETLYFDVEVMDVREATKEELDHGHVHGPGGHHH